MKKAIALAIFLTSVFLILKPSARKDGKDVNRSLANQASKVTPPLLSEKSEEGKVGLRAPERLSADLDDFFKIYSASRMRIDRVQARKELIERKTKDPEFIAAIKRVLKDDNFRSGLSVDQAEARVFAVDVLASLAKQGHKEHSEEVLNDLLASPRSFAGHPLEKGRLADIQELAFICVEANFDRASSDVSYVRELIKKSLVSEDIRKHMRIGIKQAIYSMSPSEKDAQKLLKVIFHHEKV